MAWIVVDVEADGPAPGLYSMLSVGAVVAEPDADDFARTFYAELRPVSEHWLEDAIRVGGFTREQTLSFEDPGPVMHRFAEWVQKSPGKPVFVSDNNGFDWQFVNWYFHRFVGGNPFGYSSRNLGSLYCGLRRDTTARIESVRSGALSHNALDDAIANARVLVSLAHRFGLDISGRL